MSSASTANSWIAVRWHLNGGFDLGFERAGFETVWQVEREPFCIAVLKTRFPNVERYYDITLCGQGRRHKLKPVEVVTAGFPCQDLSVAGKRAGLAGGRSGLFWELRRVLGELSPAWVVIENVPGLFSSNEGRDFGMVLNALDELGYGLAWRVLDSRYWGVAQRRRRVFLVGSFGKPCPPEVLFESESSARDFAESGEERPGIAATITGGLGKSSGNDIERNGIASTLSAANHDKSHAAGRRREDDINLAIQWSHQGRDLWASEHATALQTRQGMPGQGQAVAHALSSNGSGYRFDPNGEDYIAAAITASAGHHGYSGPRGDGSDNLVLDHADEQQHRLQGVRGEGSAAGNGSGTSSREPGRRRDSDSVHTPRLGQDGKYGESNRGSGMPSIRATGQSGEQQHDGRDVAFAQNQRGELRTSRIAPQLTTGGGKPGEGYPAAICETADSNGVRDFASLPEGLDSARYRALGNAVTVSVAQWIAERIKKVSEGVAV